MLKFGQDVSYIAQVPVFSSVNKSLEFVIILVIIAMISDLHLHGKFMSRPVQVPGAPFFLHN